jgi:hypothetical protein
MRHYKFGCPIFSFKLAISAPIASISTPEIRIPCLDVDLINYAVLKIRFIACRFEAGTLVPRKKLDD